MPCLLLVLHLELGIDDIVLLRTACIGCGAGLVALAARAEPVARDPALDWPQFRGAARDGRSAVRGLARSWPEGGPKVLWRKPIGPGFAGVAVVGDRAFTAAAEGEKEYALGLDAQTGKELWRIGGLTGQSTPTPVAADGLLYLATGSQGESNRPVIAVRPGASGDITLAKGEESNQFVAWFHPRASAYTSSPLVYRGRMYVVNDNGILTVFDSKTGKEIYKARAGGSGNTFSASPWAADGKIYLLSEDGHTFVIEAGDSYAELAKNSVEGSRNFATKLWNAARFAEMNECKRTAGFDPTAAKETINRWIGGEVVRTGAAVTAALEAYKFNEAAGAAYQFAE